MIGETQPIIRIVEVLPAPLGPRNPNDSPGATSKSIASTATNSPNFLVRPRARIRLSRSARGEPSAAERGSATGGDGRSVAESGEPGAAMGWAVVIGTGMVPPTGQFRAAPEGRRRDRAPLRLTARAAPEGPRRDRARCA